MKYLMILLTFIFFYILNIYSYSGDRENVYNDWGNSGAANKAAKQSLWSISSNDMNDWTVPVKSNGAWSTQKIKSNVNYSISKNNKIVKAQNKMQRDAEIRNFGNMKRQRIAEAQAAAKAKAREQRLQIIYENERDRQQGIAEHTARMSNYYNQKYSRDHWIMTEGARILDESVKGMDFANLPEQKFDVVSNNDLIALLEPETYEGECEIVVMYDDNTYPDERKNNVSFELGGVINFYDNINISDDDYEVWYEAITSNEVIISQDKISNLQQSPLPEAVEILYSDELPLEQMNIVTFPNMGCVALYPDSVIFFDDVNFSALSWNIDTNVTQIVICGERTLGKSRNKLVEIKSDTIETILEFDTDEFSIYPHTDTTLFVSTNIYNVAVVNNVNINRRTYDELIRVPIVINKIISNGDICFVVTEDKILQLDNMMLLWSNGEYINDVCLTSEGILIATKTSLYLCVSEDEIYEYSSMGAKKIWFDGSFVYLQTMDNSLIRISNMLET